ncbi:hypothetical protein F5B22DRAFT_635958 [Xylaria bambusicola]|uniref:uncharacterized protein n=1 Tax=Xylaria bambusicola TaxID=326684 RepID=UPI002007DF4F|nr:uncharacterized protein F5B22DRAFT_635958 [Xylaria bambusicola]KAI0517352.1 hypothetical protein F5B22DRAFT_635958 [Xylaria bambusicola]
MTRSAANITKACEVCRKAKLRCDGDTPCRRCVDKGRQADCEYRERPRVRKQTRRPQPQKDSEYTSPASHSSQQVGGVVERNVAQPEPYRQSVAATHEYASDCIFTSRLFYGPSSSFAFSQQVYRILWQSGEQIHNDHNSDTVQEGGPGLSLLKQRAIFFGIPTRVDVSSISQSINQHRLCDWLPLNEAEKLLGHFISTNIFQIPFFSPVEMTDLLHSVYNSEASASLSPQVKAVVLAILANGALNTSDTYLAESLFVRAKQEVAACDDEVSLTMTHLSLLLATYQNNIGRPHSSYLHTGVASRKIFAMGLHSYGPEGNARPDMIQKRRIMAWSVYYHETMHALFLGRESTYKKASIRTPFPDNQPTLVGLCKLAQIAEDSAATIYGSTCASLWQLYQAAEKIHGRLQACAEELGIASSAAAARSSMFTPTAILLLHNIYYHTLLLTFRPFLIAEFALHLKQPSASRNRNQMWLIRARRIAIEAAQDCIVYMNEAYHDFHSCRTIRFNAFFLESSSQALCYDMLRNPSKLSYNKEYLRTALNCLEQMVKDEPMVHTESSMTETLRIVEQHLSTNRTEQGILEHGGNGERTSPTGDVSHQQHAGSIPTVTHDFLVDESEHMIYLNGTTSLPDPLIQSQNPNFFTTDLFNFFPLDTISDDSTSPWHV